MSDFVKMVDLTFLRRERKIFDRINLNIARGKITAILGPSGSGKTTLLRLIEADLLPDQGEVFVDGANISHLTLAETYQLRKKIGWLFQSGALFTNLNVFENVAFPLREHTQLPETTIRKVVLMQLEMVGLRGANHLMPNELSGGMARRVALARTLVLSPGLILYDEPFAGQDPIAMGVLVELIKHLHLALNLTSVIVSHDIQETMSIADHVYVIAGGQIIGKGTPKQITKHPSPMVKQFVEGLADGPVPFHYPAKPYLEELGL